MKTEEVLVALGIAWLLFGRKSDTESGGGGGGGQPGGGPATVTAKMTSLKAVAAMSAGVNKVPGQLIIVKVGWTPTTKSAKGDALNWTYKVRCRLGHNTIGGWKTPGELGLQPAGSGDTTLQISNVPNGAKETMFTFNAPDDPGQVWDIRAEILGAQSDASGAPSATFQELASGESVGAITTIPGAAVVGASVQYVNASAGGCQPCGLVWSQQ